MRKREEKNSHLQHLKENEALLFLLRGDTPASDARFCSRPGCVVIEFSRVGCELKLNPIIDRHLLSRRAKITYPFGVFGRME